MGSSSGEHFCARQRPVRHQAWQSGKQGSCIELCRATDRVANSSCFGNAVASPYLLERNYLHACRSVHAIFDFISDFMQQSTFTLHHFSPLLQCQRDRLGPAAAKCGSAHFALTLSRSVSCCGNAHLALTFMLDEFLKALKAMRTAFVLAPRFVPSCRRPGGCNGLDDDDGLPASRIRRVSYTNAIDERGGGRIQRKSVFEEMQGRCFSSTADHLVSSVGRGSMQPREISRIARNMTQRAYAKSADPLGLQSAWQRGSSKQLRCTKLLGYKRKRNWN